MACWKCKCGWRNCDSDTCTNPKCTERAKEIKRQIAEQKLKEGLEKISDPTYKGLPSHRGNM